MMFVVEKLLRDHEARVQAWEHKRDKWLESHDYYTRREYEDSHPRPGHWVKTTGQVLMWLLFAAAIVGVALLLTLGVSKHHNNGKHNTAATTTQKQPDKSYTFHVNDKVQVVYGDYENSVGVIVRLDKDSAIIKLTNSTLTHAMCNASSSCSSGGGKDNGELLGVSSLDNLVPYKDVK
jgi:hypothetical protein